MPKKLTHEEFLTRLWENNEHYRNGKFEVIGEYDGLNSYIVVRDYFGDYNITPNELLKRNVKPSILTTTDKTEYFKKEVLLKNKHYRDGEFKIISEYLGRKSSIQVEYKGQVYNVSVPQLLKGKLPDIKSSFDKTLFWLHKFKEERSDFDNIDYSKVEYKTSKENVVFKCKIHNLEYLQRVDHHCNNVQGCIKCMKYPVVYNDDTIVKHKDFLQNINGFLYVIRLKSKQEDFYKVGITVESRLSYRFSELKRYYKLSFEYLQEGNMVELFNLEQLFLKNFEGKRYIPKIKFRGYTECLTTNPVAEYYHWYNNR